VLEGQVALFAGDLDAAQGALDGVPESLAASGQWFSAAVAAQTLGGVRQAHGDVAGATARYRTACEHFAACGDVCSLDGAAADLAEAATQAGRVEDAAAACEYALGFAPDRPLGERGTHLMHQAALVAGRAGRHEDAARYVAEAAVAARRDPVVIGPWHAPAAAGDLALLGGEAQAARDRYLSALRLAARIGAERGRSLPAALYLMATELRLAEAATDRGTALGHARAALAHAQASRAPAAVAAAATAVQQLEAAVAAQ
jgi:tetratricopeptide (TPR) repeat protein